MYMLDNLGLSEHGTGVYGSWLTEKGKLVEDLLTLSEARGEFEEDEE